MCNSHLVSTVFRFMSLASRITFLPIILVIGTKFISRLIELYCKCHRYRKYPLSKYHCPVWKDLKKCPVLKVTCVKIKSRGNFVLSTEIFFLDTDQNFTQCKHKLHSCFFWDVELLQFCLIERTPSSDEKCQWLHWTQLRAMLVWISYS